MLEESNLRKNAIDINNSLEILPQVLLKRDHILKTQPFTMN